MTAGALLATAAVLGVAVASSLAWFVVAWIAVGAAMSAVLYQPAFAALTAMLVADLGWRRTYLTLAVVLAAITVPAHLLGLRGTWPSAPAVRDEPAAHDPETVVRSRPFVLLAVTMSMAAFAAYAGLTNLVPLLTGRGLSASAAALALGLGGIGQVSGRLGYSRMTARTSVRTRTVIILGAVSVTLLVLAAVPGPPELLIAAAILAGSARGLFTLLQATAITDRWGTTHYGRLNGMLYAPIMLASALGPWAGTALGEALGGRPRAFGVLAAVTAAAAILATVSVPAQDAASRKRRRLTQRELTELSTTGKSDTDH